MGGMVSKVPKEMFDKGSPEEQFDYLWDWIREVEIRVKTLEAAD